MDDRTVEVNLALVGSDRLAEIAARVESGNVALVLSRGGQVLARYTRPALGESSAEVASTIDESARSSTVARS